jgi:Peptidase family M1 domain
MRRAAATAGMVLLWAVGAVAAYQPIWRIQHYELEYEILPGAHIYRGQATLSVENVSDRDQTTLPLALYRLQDVEGVEDAAGQPCPFVAEVVKAPDRLGFQAVQITVKLPNPVAPGKTLRLRVRHSGPMLGYQELMRYTKDGIGEDFSLLRQDVLAYPQLGPVTDRDLSGNILAQIAAGWTFHLAVTVPKPLVVAASGRQVKRTDVDANRWRYEFESVLPTWRIDIAVADYQTVEQPDRGLKVYVFPADFATANQAMELMAKAIQSFTEWFGPVEGAGYTLIEIPEGYGSQAGTRYFLQTADALKNREALPILAHEISHTWNAPSREEYNSRFLDEAFATYFQALADEVLAGPGAKQRRLEEYRALFARRLEEHPEWGKVAIRDYGREDLGELSYLKGPWSLAVLDELVGHDPFKKTVRTFLARYRASGATPAEFRAVAEEVSGRKLDSFWSEWFEQGEVSTSLMQQQLSAAEIAARYR